MKHKIWIHQLISALFAFVLAVSSVGNLITGYELPVEALWKIWLWGALAAVTVAVLFQTPYGGKIIIGLAALGVFGLCLAELFRPHIFKQISTLLYCITSHYHGVYNWPLLGTQSASDVSVPLILWAVLVAFCVNWYICRRKHIAVAIIPTVAPLVLCLLTEDKVPNAVYPYLLIAGLGILLVTDWTRRMQPDQGVKLTLWLTLPITLAFAVEFICNPKANYVNYAGKIQKELSVWFEEVQDVAVSVVTGTPIDGSGNERINLQAVGSKSTSTRSVMIVNSPVGGKLYLRERDYDVYTGTAWVATKERKEKFTSGSKNSVGTLTIATYSTRSKLFVPYYSTSALEMVGGALENEDNLQQYRYTLSKEISGKTPLPGANYKALPAETKAWATEIVKKLRVGVETEAELVYVIQDYVRRSAVYDTTAVRMDASYTDFARWFLEECDTGYCVHYATAATVLLRAAEIPARYVEGYTVNCKKGTDVPVSKQDAHAWVEYYDATTKAWYILEVTPTHEESKKPAVLPGESQIGNEIQGESEDILIENEPEVIPPGEKLPEGTLPEKEPEEPTTLPEVPEETVEDPVPPVQGIIIPQNLRKIIKIACMCLAFVLGVLLQRYVRLFRKRKLWNSGNPNACTIWRWRQTRSLANLLNQYYPEELDDLAKKARFSQHEMQPPELQKYEDYRLHLVELIAEKPWYQRIFFKWILAIDCR